MVVGGRMGDVREGADTELVFLGTGAGNGVPVFYCGCEVCREAERDPRCRRTRSALAVLGAETSLIDAPPELMTQLAREGIRRVDHLYLTHAHSDHTAGLADLAIYSKFHLKRPIPAVMSGETRTRVEILCEGGTGQWLDVTVLEPGETIERGGLRCTGLAASHAPGTLGFLMETEGFRFAYVPDTGPLSREARALLRGIDCLMLDATFHEGNLYPDHHLTVEQAMEVGRALEVKRLYLTHLSMHYTRRVTTGALKQVVAQHGGGVEIAHDGLRLRVAT
jgi:phosphoribosyl 1,2-cyclic phosphate phosphodiesterase